MKNTVKEIFLSLSDDLLKGEEWIDRVRKTLDKAKAVALADEQGELGQLVSYLAERNHDRPFTQAELDRIASSVEPPEIKPLVGERLVDAIAREMAETPHGPEKRILMDRLRHEATALVRDYVKENSVLYRILPPNPASDNVVYNDRHELGVYCDLEPDAPAAKWVPTNTEPTGEYVSDPRYWIPMSRVITPEVRIDVVDILRGRKRIGALLEEAGRGIVELLDRHLMDAVDGICKEADGPGTADFADSNDVSGRISNPNRISGKCQWMAGLPTTYEGFMDATKMLPCGNENGKFVCRNRCLLSNDVTAARLIRGVYGPPKPEDYENGVCHEDILGVKAFFTTNRDLVKDGDVYFFAEPDFLGRFLRMDDWTVYMKNEAFFLEFFAYFMGGFAIGNTAGVALAQFDMGGEAV